MLAEQLFYAILLSHQQNGKVPHYDLLPRLLKLSTGQGFWTSITEYVMLNIEHVMLNRGY